MPIIYLSLKSTNKIVFPASVASCLIYNVRKLQMIKMHTIWLAMMNYAAFMYAFRGNALKIFEKW